MAWVVRGPRGRDCPRLARCPSLSLSPAYRPGAAESKTDRAGRAGLQNQAPASRPRTEAGTDYTGYAKRLGFALTFIILGNWLWGHIVNKTFGYPANKPMGRKAIVTLKTYIALCTLADSWGNVIKEPSRVDTTRYEVVTRNDGSAAYDPQTGAVLVLDKAKYDRNAIERELQEDQLRTREYPRGLSSSSVSF